METFTPFTFVHSTRRVLFGWNALERLPELAAEFAAKRPALVIDEYFTRTPLLEKVIGFLKAPSVHATPAGREPDTATVEACAAALRERSPDFIVALGGGSAMDTAKVARMLLTDGKTLSAHASVLIAVPTTHGTGSEVSESAVIGKEGADAKLIYRSQEMTPQIALLDPALTLGAPRSVTAYAGYDAVTHAVEAYVSRMASPMTDPYALSAMELLGEWLVVAYEEPENRDARSACLIASMQAAIAFNSANLGLAHAISGPLGAQQHVAHGLGNALALPYVTAYNEPVLGAKGETIARLFGARTAAEAMAKLRRRLGLDLSLDAYVKTDNDRERLAQWAMKSGQVKMNPRAAKLEDMRAILAAMRSPTGDAPPVLK
jgi:alcohol dehydrogenase class IV